MTKVPLKRQCASGLRANLNLRMLAFVLMITLLPNCGAKKKSQEIGIAVLPEKPIVITADTKDIFDKEIKAPWFMVRPVISNGSSSTLTVITIKFTTMGLDSSGGGMIEKTWSGMPSDFRWTRPQGLSSHSCDFSHFGEFKPGAADQTLYLGGDKICQPCDINGDPDPEFRDPLLLPSEPTSQGFCINRPRFALGDGPGGPSMSFTAWNVQIQPIGWFGTFNDPEDRFMKISSFRTQ